MVRIVPRATAHRTALAGRESRRWGSRLSAMTEKLVLVPGPDHPITVSPADPTVTVRWDERVIAKTDDALVLQESTYRPVYYLPLDSVES